MNARPYAFLEAYLVALEPGCFGSLRKGQSQRATVVNVVSREFDSVLVEQNHCHGLTTVKKSWKTGQ
jgi:hypothetical protein